MDDEDYSLWLHFKLKLLESSGDSFQHFFEDIMREEHGSNFEAVLPWQGDGGNDGFIPSQGHYFQVYGPQPLSGPGINAPAACTKASKDFDKLITTWPNVTHYSFVLNDRFDGVPAPIFQSLAVIEDDYSVSTSVISAAKLETTFLSLTKEAKQRVLRCPPIRLSQDFVAPSVVRELLTYLEDNLSPNSRWLNGHELPDFSEKVEFNGLSIQMSRALHEAYYFTNDIDVFLKERTGLSQLISEQMHAWYLDSMNVISSSIESCSDLRFIYILKKLLPQDYEEQSSLNQLCHQQIALSVMSKYFETCDIYENPVHTDSP